MALALVALCASVAAVATLKRISAVDLGFGGTSALAVQVVLPQARYQSSEAVVSYLDRAVAAVEALPGVRRAAVTGPLPGNKEVGMAVSVRLAGPPVDGPKPGASGVLIASPDYFTVMGIRQIAGRGFADADRRGAPPVVVISQSLARRLTDEPAAAVGRIVEIPWNQDREQFEVIGVVSDVLMRGAEVDVTRVEQLYFAAAQDPPYGTVSLVAEVDGAAGAMAQQVADAVGRVDTGVPAYGLQTINGIADRYLASHRLVGILVSTFAVMTLVVAAVGLYGVMAQVVIERRREIGIRLALGAARQHVRRRLLGGGLALTAVGAAVGLLTAAAALGGLAAIVPALERVSPATYVIATVLLMTTGALAIWGPAARAAAIDPGTVLRENS